ncbi:protein of unknown function [Trichlorobacter ammonificans]|uniref:Uncharacterized protein n=1 Tax=Trichlorobacter ammonificans TaxID=2916410 RepID=A0ABM9D8R3_9BACT|nr:protein of unknown function [Trichlorobacter ammonificans]
MGRALPRAGVLGGGHALVSIHARPLGRALPNPEVTIC